VTGPAGNKRNFFLLGAALLCFGFALAWRGFEIQEPLKLALGTRLGAEAMAFALEVAGDSAPEDLRAVEMLGVTAVARALQNRVVDAAVLSVDEAIQVTASDLRLRVLMVTEISNGTDVLLKRREGGAVEGLRGGRIGVELLSSGHYLLFYALRESGLSLQDVELIPIAPRELPEGAAFGNLDAIVAIEPEIRLLRHHGLHPVFSSKLIDPQIKRVLVAREDSMPAHRAALTGALKCYFKTQSQLKVEDGAFAQFLEARTGLTSAEVHESVRKSRFPGLKENKELFTSGRLASVIQTITQNMLTAGLLNTVPSEPLIVDASLLEEL
jgi:NitT/TauT family transport system substrate-binding protein